MPQPERRSDDTHHVERNARMGLWLFAIYLLLYGVYVGLSAFRPQVMDVVVAAGVNLAIVYGFGLIAAAILLALVYGWLADDARES